MIERPKTVAPATRGSATVKGIFASAVIVLGLAIAAGWRARRADSNAKPELSTGQVGPEPAAASPALPARTPSPEPPAPAVAAAPSPPTPAPPPSDDEQIARLRLLSAGKPAAAVDLATEDDQRFPESPYRSERTSILIHALAEEGRAGEARGKAEEMVNSYPDSPWVAEIERFTGAHRHRNVRVADDGGLEFY